MWGVFEWIPGWAAPFALALVAGSAGALLHQMAYVGIRRFVPSSRRVLCVIVNRLRLPTQLFFIIVIPTLLMLLLPISAAQRDLAVAASAVFAVILAGWCGIVVTGVLLESTGRRYGSADEGAEIAAGHRRALRMAYIASIFTAVFAVAAVLGLFVGSSSIASMVLVIVCLLTTAFVLWRGRSVIDNFVAAARMERHGALRRDGSITYMGDVGWIEDVTPTYTIVRLWNWRRVIVPHTVFAQQLKAADSWTSDSIETAVDWHVDYKVPIDRVRAKLVELAASHALWDGETASLHVAEAGASTLRLRAVLSARTPEGAWDLRSDIREAMLRWLRDNLPDALPQQLAGETGDGAARLPSARHRLAKMGLPTRLTPNQPVPAK